MVARLNLYPILGLLAVAVFMTCSACFAGVQSLSRPAGEARVPDFDGAAGLLRAPSAYVQSDGQISAFLTQTSHSTYAGAVAGLFNRVELGVASRPFDGGDRQAVGIAKLNLMKEQLLTPAISVGVVDAFSSASGRRSVYVVASKYVIPYFVEAVTGRKELALKLHAGYGDGLFHRRVFGGVEVVGSGGLSAIGEVVGGRADAGVRYAHAGFAATVGWMDMRDAAGSISYSVRLK
jgi:hypothetical protein